MNSDFFPCPARLIGAGLLIAACLASGARAEEHHHHADNAGATAAPPHHHHADEAAPEAFPEPPPGSRWATDAPLRTGMNRIRSSATSVLAAQARGTLQGEQAEALQRTLNTEFALMAAKCELAPDADAALHVIIVRLMEAAAHLVQDPNDAPGAALLRKALNHYGTAFDHPDWTPLPDAEQP
jgi:hypothetical protein